MASTVDICNGALNQLGATTILSLTEDSKNARLCNSRYTQVRDGLFRINEYNFSCNCIFLVKYCPNLYGAFIYLVCCPIGRLYTDSKSNNISSILFIDCSALDK